MKKWEYCMRFMKKGQEAINEINELGKQGWEIINFSEMDSIYITFIFKREITLTT